MTLTGPDWPEDAPEERILLWWGVTTSALVLAERLIARDLRDARVVELGCGLGLAGIAAGRAGARVTFTDLSPEALACARDNARANGVPADRTTFEQLDWEAPGASHRGAYDLVLGTEILYDYLMHGALLHLLPALLAPGGRLLLADRRRLVVERILGRLREVGFRGERSDHHPALPGEEPQAVSIWEWQRLAQPGG